MKKRISVLIVDESQTFTMYLALLLQRIGFKTLRVSQAESAKFVLSRGFTDALIVGDLAGDEPKQQVVRELAKCCQGTAIPIIALSEHDDAAERQACHAAGCISYLPKPVRPAELHEVLYQSLKPFAETRVHLRSRVDMVTEISMQARASQPLRILSLSAGGALVAFHQTVAIGTEVAMRLPLKDETLVLNGTVIYNLADKDIDSCQGFCVMFHGESPLPGIKIEKYLEESLEECQLLSSREQAFAEAGRRLSPRW